MNEFITAMTADERARLRAALRWAHRSKWVRTSGRLPTWLAPDRGTAVIMTRTCLFVCRPHKPVCQVSTGCIDDALGVLAVLGLIPARFSTLGRDALLDHARVCERFAAHLLVGRDNHPAVSVATWIDAADSARRFAETA